MNKPTEKQKCIAEQAVYGDLTGYDLKDTYYCKHPSVIVGFQSQLVYIGCVLNKVEAIKPILRPLSDLTKETTHKGYNDDKPFIPLVELAKTQYKDFKVDAIEILDERSTMCKGYSKEISKRIMKENVKCNCAYWFHPLSSERCDEERDLLHQWHFDTRNLIEQGEAIDVNTLDVNPYTKTK